MEGFGFHFKEAQLHVEPGREGISDDLCWRYAVTERFAFIMFTMISLSDASTTGWSVSNAEESRGIWIEERMDDTSED